ncbi:helix-turn-helix transcriptional regulator (plasmid) [Clavibacter michiganensis]|uniref:helix-turn-helix domain-containing protein n=1 Tax=Clavibacter michiganensis TaxID=28447 RepID=UPI003DA154DF
MSLLQTMTSPLALQRAKARAKLLAREDRLLKAELVRMRQEAGLTQAMVGELMGTSQQAVNKIERYDSDPKLSTLRRYANAVGVLVEHRATKDVGQSIGAASATRWGSASRITSKTFATELVVRSMTTVGWTGSTSADLRVPARAA